MAQVNTAAVTLETGIVPAQTIGQGYLLQIIQSLDINKKVSGQIYSHLLGKRQQGYKDRNEKYPTEAPDTISLEENYWEIMMEFDRVLENLTKLEKNREKL